jgi:hypothetical protein
MVFSYHQMKRSTIILLCSVFLAFSAAAASTTTFPVALKEVNGGYVVKKIWLEHYALPKVHITDVQYKPGVLIPAEAVPSDPSRFEMVLGMERKRPFILVKVPAYSFEAPTATSKRITELTITVDETAGEQAGSTAPAAAKSTAAASVLASGTWYKVSIPSTGFYKLDQSLLTSLGVDPATVNTANIRVYGNGGNMLSENNAVPRRSDLTENAIWMNDGGDGTFGPTDYAVFYATGPMEWKKDSANARFVHSKNLYEEKAYYYINFDLGPGLRVQGAAPVGAANVTVSDFDHYAVYENDLVNPLTLGKEWWGEEFSGDPGKTLNRSFTMDLGALTSEPARFKVRVASRCEASPNGFSVAVNGGNYTTSLGSSSFIPLPEGYITFDRAVSGNVTVDIAYQPAISNGKGYLNYIEVNARRQLNISGQQQLLFRDWRSVGAGNIANYQIQGAGPNTQVWDITDPLSPVRMNGSLNGGTYSFTQEASMLHEFAALNGSELAVPVFVEKVTNQNLHGLGPHDYIIVTHPKFIDQANELADFHRQTSGLQVIVVTPQQVYNEFSSGSQDISAIRDFARMFYVNAGTDTSALPRYLLLFGDASYDYKDRIANNSNYVPTFESLEFAALINSYCNDDFFTFLDDNENIENLSIPNTMDLGVGRFPVTTVQDAKAMVAKIKNYKSPASLGPWKLSVTMAADNADNAGDHMDDAETMGNTILGQSNIYNVTKVYLDAIERVSTPAGLRAPDANKAINDQIFKGTFLLNYSGHGNTQVLAEERIIIQDDYSKWKNFNKLPIIITATCDYGQFDHPEYVSSGEALMLKNDGGAIATLTTTQLVYAAPNKIINRQFLEDQFDFHNGKNYSLGDAFRIAKNVTYQVSQNQGELINFRKFALLGDPALVPAFPEHNIQIETLHDGVTMGATDTIKALGSYVITGKIVDDNNALLQDFDGRVYITIYDKPRNVRTLTNENRTYKVQNNIIYKGRATAENGLFSLSFIAPKDINYDMGRCKISAYAENGITDGAGADTTFVVGGFSDNPVTEDMPPIVRPYIDDSLFRDGGITGATTKLFVVLEDETGINVSGNTVGHDLTGVLDNDLQNPYLLNDYYETAPNTYKRGYVLFPVTGLSNGKHTLRVKAWDVNNNSGEGVVNFEVVDGEVVKVNNLMNYPNPFSDKTHFVFEHNHPGEALDVSINIYSTAGYLVRTIRQNFTPEGSRSTEITWDGTDNNGAQIPSGLYVYRLDLATKTGIHESAYQKLVIIR